MSYVVVIFGSSTGGWCDLNYCPMEAVGLFTTHHEAAQEAARYPDAFRPHVLPWRERGGEMPAPRAPGTRADERHGQLDPAGWPVVEREDCP